MGLWEDAKISAIRTPPRAMWRRSSSCHPGFHVLVTHKIAHFLYNHRCFFLAPFCQPAGAPPDRHRDPPRRQDRAQALYRPRYGIVFGESDGDRRQLHDLPRVTLGGTGKDTGKRHPTLGDNVLIGAGAKVLGPVYIGDNVRVGAGSVVLKNLPANATAVGVPAEIVRVGNIKCCPADDLDQQDLPDIVNQRISELEARLSRLEAEKQGEFPPDKKE